MWQLIGALLVLGFGVHASRLISMRRMPVLRVFFGKSILAALICALTGWVCVDSLHLSLSISFLTAGTFGFVGAEGFAFLWPAISSFFTGGFKAAASVVKEGGEKSDQQ